MRPPSFVASLRALLASTVLLAPACGTSPPSLTKPSDGEPTAPTGAQVEGATNSEQNGGDVFGGSDAGSTHTIESDAGCATGSGVANRRPVHMLLVVDRSGSMRGVKWTAESAAVTAVVNDLGHDADPTLALGLDFFADPSTNDANVEEPLGPMDATKAQRIAALIAKTKPETDTPTFDALTLGYNTLASYKPTGALADGSKVLVLVTDGKPSPNLAHLGNPKSEPELIYDLVDGAAKKGTRTFSVGVGPFPSTTNGDYDPRFMGHVAVSGQTRRTPTCNPDETTNAANTCHFQVTPPASGSPTQADIDALKKAFVDALKGIRGEVASCDFTLSFAAGAKVDFAKVNVVFTDSADHRTVFDKDGQNGWSYDNDQAPTSVRLSGSACEKVKATPGKVSVILGCAPGDIY